MHKWDEGILEINCRWQISRGDVRRDPFSVTLNRLQAGGHWCTIFGAGCTILRCTFVQSRLYHFEMYKAGCTILPVIDGQKWVYPLISQSFQNMPTFLYHPYDLPANPWKSFSSALWLALCHLIWASNTKRFPQWHFWIYIDLPNIL